MDTVWITLLAMSGITFTCRYLFLSHTITLELNEPLRRFLHFTAPAVLTAMWAPIVFNSGAAKGSLINPYVIAGLATIVLSLVTRSTLTVVVAGMAIFMGCRFWLG